MILGTVAYGGDSDCGGDFVVMITEKENLLMYSTADRKLKHDTKTLETFELPTTKFVNVSAGKTHAVALDDNGSVWTWLMYESTRSVNANTTIDTETVLGREGNRTIPRSLGNEAFKVNNIQHASTAAVMVACGRRHTMVLMKDGTVWTFGFGGFGQLGHDSCLPELKPKRIDPCMFHNKNIVMVAAGEFHSMAVSTSGDIYTWGSSRDGQLGHGRIQLVVATPLMIERRFFDSSGVVLVAGGKMHSVVVTARGSIFMWGHGNFRGLGLEHPVPGERWCLCESRRTLIPTQMQYESLRNSPRPIMVTCGADHTVILTDDKNLWIISTLENIPEKIQRGFSADAEIVTIAAGDDVSTVVTNDGALYTFNFDMYAPYIPIVDQKPVLTREILVNKRFCIHQKMQLTRNLSIIHQIPEDVIELILEDCSNIRLKNTTKIVN